MQNFFSAIWIFSAILGLLKGTFWSYGIGWFKKFNQTIVLWEPICFVLIGEICVLTFLFWQIRIRLFPFPISDFLVFSADAHNLIKGCALPGNATCEQIKRKECPQYKWDAHFNCKYSNSSLIPMQVFLLKWEKPKGFLNSAPMEFSEFSEKKNFAKLPLHRAYKEKKIRRGLIEDHT